MIVGIMANGLNILLDWILVFGKFGFPAMGIVGAGLATIASSFFALCMIFLVIVFRKETRTVFGIFENLRPDFQILRKIVRYGFPAGAHFFLGVSSFSIFLLMLGRLGDVPLAAANIAFSIEGISFMPVLGFATAIGIISGQEKGGGRPENVPAAVKKGIMIALVYNVAIITLFNFFPEALISIFNRGGEAVNFDSIISLTVPLIHLTSLWLIFDSIQLILSETLKSLGDTFFLMTVSGVFPFLFFIIPSYLAAFVWKLPLYSLWIIIVLWVIVLFFIMLGRFLQGKWRMIDLI
jgi:MATE family multidrug resistance protein